MSVRSQHVVEIIQVRVRDMSMRVLTTTQDQSVCVICRHAVERKSTENPSKAELKSSTLDGFFKLFLDLK